MEQSKIKDEKRQPILLAKMSKESYEAVLSAQPVSTSRSRSASTSKTQVSQIPITTILLYYHDLLLNTAALPAFLHTCASGRVMGIRGGMKQFALSHNLLFLIFYKNVYNHNTRWMIHTAIFGYKIYGCLRETDSRD